jgi:hypothetical protein
VPGLFSSLRAKIMTSPSTPEEATQAISKKEVRAQQGQEAMTEYRAEQKATVDKTARLRALRLAQDTKQTEANCTASESDSAKHRLLPRTMKGLHQGVRG